MQNVQRGDGFFVPNDFIETNLFELDELAVRVYLYAKFMAQKNGGKVSCDALFSVFGARDVVRETLRTLIRRGCMYMDKTSVITFTPPLQEEKPQYTQAEVSESVDRDVQLRMLMQAAEQVLGKMLTASAAECLYGMYDWLGLPVEVILKLLEYCVGLGKKSMAYIEKVAITWHKEGIVTIEAAEAYLAIEAEKRGFMYKAKSIFGIDNRNLTTKEEELIGKWQHMGVTEPLLRFAFEYAVEKTGKVAFAYMDKVLCAWISAGAYTPEQAQSFIDAYHREHASDKPKTTKSVGSKKPAVFGSGNYDFDEIRRRARENIRKKIGEQPEE